MSMNNIEGNNNMKKGDRVKKIIGVKTMEGTVITVGRKDWLKDLLGTKRMVVIEENV